MERNPFFGTSPPPALYPTVGVSFLPEGEGVKAWIGSQMCTLVEGAGFRAYKFGIQVFGQKGRGSR